jgi:hypothetical protein
MDVEIGEVVTTVKAIDGNALLTPEILQQIVNAVRRAVQDDASRAV